MPFNIMGNRRRTIVLVDQDPQFRASLRLELEAAGFSVGEAASGKEGERTALRIRPDAILVDLMLEQIDTGSLMAQRLREVGKKFPIYVVSSAAAWMQSDLNFQDLGITGVFAKPVDTKAVIQTLNTYLDRDR
jgi:two-component system chemotaxis response regulator CheY